MAKSQVPTAQDVRDLFRLLSDVRACPEPGEQGRVLVDGMCQLIGADMGWFAEVQQQGRTFRPTAAGQGTHRDETIDRFVASWGESYPIDFDLMAVAVVNETRPIFVKHWDQIRREAPLHRYEPFCDLVQTLRVSDMVDPGFSLRPGHYFAMNLQRRQGQRKFSACETALVEMAAAELRWMAETGRLSLSALSQEEQYGELPPRLRQVLTRLLAGQTPKAIARSMHISLWTVREHIQRLYRHYEVTGRDELMSRFVKR